MEQRKEELGKRPLYVYNLPQDILTTLTRKDNTKEGSEEEAITTTSTNAEADATPKSENAVGSKSCSLCGIKFYTVEDQRSHVRSDFHGYNLKQRVRGAKPVAEGEFEKLIGDLDESLSGSDSSDSDDEDGGARKETTLSALLKKQAAISANHEEEDPTSSEKRKRGSGRPPLIWFITHVLPSNTYLGIYRAILTNAEQDNEAEIAEIIRKRQLTPKAQLKVVVDWNNGVPLPETYKGPHIFLCMIGGGHFAAMVVSLAPKQTKSAAGPLSKEATVLAHKTFHRYTTRRKQGGAQSANDSAKGAAHSAGSSLRRYNEQALTDEVRLLLQDWKGMIDTSELLFIRATGNTNRRTLFGPYDGQVLRQKDPRIRGFPFSTRRATQNELMRSFTELTRVKILEVDEAAIAAAKAKADAESPSPTASKPKKSTPVEKPKLSEEEETAMLHTTQIQTLIRRSRLPALLSYLSTNSISPNFVFHPPDHHAPTPLHLAASTNSAVLVEGLLLKAEANPTITNGDGKMAFDLAGDRRTRDIFRLARKELGKAKWEWEKTNIGPGLSRAEVEERDKKEKAEEKKKEEERREKENKRLDAEGARVDGDGKTIGKAQEKGRQLALGKIEKAAQEKRVEEMKGMTPEMRARVERERRARAAEERMKRMGGGG